MGGTPKLYEHTFMITKKIYILMCFQIFPLRITLFFNESYFYSRSFQKYSRTSVENSRTFQGYPTNFQFSSTFQGPCKPCYTSPNRKVCLWHIFFALPAMNGPFPAELKFRENTGVVENIKHLMTGLKGKS